MIATCGVALIVTVIVARPVLPAVSVAEAAMMCVPADSVLAVTLGPVPRRPSRLEVQMTAEARFPSSTSVAVAVKAAVAPGSKLAPVAGAVIATVGVALTAMVIVARPVLLALSVAAAVIVWMPVESVLTVIVAPVPSAPSRLEVQTIREVRVPSSTSVAVPVKVTAAPGSNVVPVGAVIATTGVALTVMVIMVWVVLPPLSVTVAVMVCVPVESALAVIVRPVPSAPSRLEVQAMVAERSPSSVSLAEPVKVTAAPGSNVAPVAGAVIRTAGVLLTVMVIEARPVLPPLSVAAAVITCVPLVSVLLVIVLPVPRLPSRLELQVMLAVRVPSSTSVAVPLSVTGAPSS